MKLQLFLCGVTLMDNNIFEGLEDLGFDNIKSTDLYSARDKEVEKKEEAKVQVKSEKEFIYDKEVVCPICNFKFNAKAVKASSYRVGKKSSDLFTDYTLVNPYFYDVWVCNSCGYSAMKSDFEKIKSHQAEEIHKRITTKWNGKTYPDIYDVDVAIERYKLALLNTLVMDGNSSRKAYNCLKLAWMYRIKEDKEKEQAFLGQALEGFNKAYFEENFPIYGMDKFTTMYLIGELFRRIGDNDNAMKWFSQVITTPNVNSKVKEMAKDQKDLIKFEEAALATLKEETAAANEENAKKEGLFSKFFK